MLLVMACGALPLLCPRAVLIPSEVAGLYVHPRLSSITVRIQLISTSQTRLLMISPEL
jgi:hypothetical protein